METFQGVIGVEGLGGGGKGERLRMWSSTTTPPPLLTTYQVRAATGEQCFVAGAMTITSAYANPAARYDGSTTCGVADGHPCGD